jgi:hypothetical protein
MAFHPKGVVVDLVGIVSHDRRCLLIVQVSYNSLKNISILLLVSIYGSPHRAFHVNETVPPRMNGLGTAEYFRPIFLYP